MRIKKWLFPTPPPADVWFHASRITPRTVSRTKLDTDPRESSSGLESDIYYKRGVVFVVPLGKKLYSLLSRRILSITVLLEKKKKEYFSSETLSFSPVTFRLALSSSARLDGHGGVASPLSRLNRVEKTGHRETRSAVRWDRLKRRETMMEQDSIKSTMK